MFNYLKSSVSRESPRKDISKSQKSTKSDSDFDEEARKLWKQLNLDYDSRSSSVWNPTDPIWKVVFLFEIANSQLSFTF